MRAVSETDLLPLETYAQELGLSHIFITTEDNWFSLLILPLRVRYL